jgi:hypothetical protein
MKDDWNEDSPLNWVTLSTISMAAIQLGPKQLQKRQVPVQVFSEQTKLVPATASATGSYCCCLHLYCCTQQQHSTVDYCCA